MTDGQSLLKKFYSIIDAEKKRAQDENNGQTDLETVATRVKKICKPFLDSLLTLLGQLYFNILIGRRMKHGTADFRFRKKQATAAASNPAPPEANEYLFEGMEPLRGYPAQLTYEDKPGHVVYVNSRRSLKDDRHKGAEYLLQLLEWDKQRIRIVQKGNRWGDEQVDRYGDLPLEELVKRWKQDQEREMGQS